MKSQIAKITTSLTLGLIINSLSIYALGETSLARLPIKLETQKKQVTEEKTNPLIDKLRKHKLEQNTIKINHRNWRRIRRRPSCYRRWVYNRRLKRWVKTCVRK
ncbi:MAG: hypothetical protein KI793_23800 [Rivularia sp. (in: Bacteria)]|nr:hypothetical protein [Rivularia sp. MS3]